VTGDYKGALSDQQSAFSQKDSFTAKGAKSATENSEFPWLNAER
jgi:hypothetical protein